MLAKRNPISPPAGAMAASLGGFNVGVEIGQESIVLVFLPLPTCCATPGSIARWGSLLIVAIATGWFVQRAFDILIPSFSAIISH